MVYSFFEIDASLNGSEKSFQKLIFFGAAFCLFVALLLLLCFFFMRNKWFTMDNDENSDNLDNTLLTVSRSTLQLKWTQKLLFSFILYV